MSLSWEEIARRPGFEGVRRFLTETVVPQLEQLPTEPSTKDGAPKQLACAVSLSFALFIGLFLLTFFVLPVGDFGVFLRFVLFFPLFFASFAFVFWLHRETLARLILRAHVRYTVRAQAWRDIAGKVDLKYIPRPGGDHPLQDWLVKQSWVPEDLAKALKEAPQTDLSMSPAVEIAKNARIMGRDPVVIGTKVQKKQMAEQALQLLNVEDGFLGRRGNIEFYAFEWFDSQDDGPGRHHLIIVLALPRPVNGISELRSRKLSWLAFRDQARMQAVDLGPKAFHDQYRLRSSDQVESRFLFDLAVIERLLSMAHQGPFRAVARGEHLVIDIEGDNRFEIVDVQAGVWDEERLRKGISELAETLDLVDTIAGVFKLG